MANPAFGRHGWVAAHGDTAKRAPRRIVASKETVQKRTVRACPLCGRAVDFDTDRRGATIVIEAGRIHVCELAEVLAKQANEEGAEILTTLRRAINERRMYGEAV